MALVFGVSSISGAICQTSTTSEDTTLTVHYDDNVKKSLSLKEEAQIREVYGSNAEDYVLNRPQQLKDIKNILRNRIEIVDAGMKDLSSITRLSEVELFNDLVPNLTRDSNFDPQSFNPLKYKFNFYSRDITKYYWVDNTSFLIIIKSQYQQF